MYKLSCNVSVVAALYSPVLLERSTFVETATLDIPNASLILPVTDERNSSFNAVLIKEPATTSPSTELSPFSPGLPLFPTKVLSARDDIISSLVFPEEDENLILGLLTFPLTFISILSPSTLVLASKITNGSDTEAVTPLTDGTNLISAPSILKSFPFTENDPFVILYSPFIPI